MAQKDTQGGIKERTRLNFKVPHMYKVILVNDDFTPMDFVVEILTNIFRLDTAHAHAVMLQVHHQGKGIAGVYTLDRALTLSNQAMQQARDNGYPLRLKCEPE
ncbi:ATP-dependent Clp protease adaptor ClpS [Sodaliphilus sp.]|uniref:ATP-dependent Clp protease adaptor ClpS n=1 Tax=Sodaliphilus sp. TaxID=2815818 RepID=UPI003890422C